MSKIIKNTGDIKAIAEIVEERDLLFLPSPPHRRAKSKFWTRFSDLDTGRDISLAAAMQLTGEPQLARWWKTPGFKAWFLNKDEARERLEYLYMVALDSAEQVLLNPDANDNAKVQMVKVIAQLAGKEPSKTERFADEDIQKMDQDRLRAYIQKNAPKLIEAGDTNNDKERVDGEAGPKS